MLKTQTIQNINFCLVDGEVEISANYTPPDDFCGEVLVRININTKDVFRATTIVTITNPNKIEEAIKLVNKKIDLYNRMRNKPKYKDLIFVTKQTKIGFSFIHRFDKSGTCKILPKWWNNKNNFKK